MNADRIFFGDVSPSLFEGHTATKMGLAGQKNKVKIGHDPRNTVWSNDTSRFGHKHMEKLGWAPGMGLGTGSSGREAMTSHVKVTVKVDNTGLGKKSSQKSSGGLDDEITTGLDVFQRLLGKLNGKTDAQVDNQLMKQRQRMVLGNSKFGMVFEFGGLLQGSLEKSVDELGGDAECETSCSEFSRSKKRKRDDSKSGKSRDKKKRARKEDSSKEKSKSKDRTTSKKDKNDKQDKKEKKDKKDKREKSKDRGTGSPTRESTPLTSRESTPVLRGRQAYV
jgi:Pin2-interacting protein X1